MTDRRTLLTAAAAALATPLATARRSRPVPAAGISEHYVPGGTRGIQRGQFTYTATDRFEGYGVIRLPDAKRLFMVPLTKLVFDESSGAKFAIQGDGVLTVLKDDLYELTTNMDWPAQARGSGQDGYDVDSRKLQILRARVGVNPPVYIEDQVTPIVDSGQYDRLATHDMPGASVPQAVRITVPWEPGTVAPGAMAYVDVALPTGSFAPAVGDLVRVSHTSLTDAVLGAQNIGILISGRIVAPGVARVIVENRYGVQAVAIPSGSMNVLAESAVASAGNNQDAWCYLGSGPVMLLAGEKLFVGVRSSSLGDFLQISNSSFLRISNVVP
ncbi:MAG TPA: hypothetical protein VFY73_13440 [Ideonella sp.]|uniref:hypothetical protein n=1 Tax=Ideonella sp. TaxID=1929293 RepID=UPI002E2FB9EE|nr:hypothetical protein [Ideonella sp.]HEX5685020.1 hypothetical protein [Ideonella sp.]